VIALLVALVGLGAMVGARAVDNACLPLAGPCERVLFIGNSYTYVNDLPAVFRHVARAAGHAVVTGIVANGGETLEGHASSTETTAEIAQGWQVVVLQEQSEIPSVASIRQQAMYPAVRELVALIRTQGGSPVLLQTWAHRDGWSDNGLDYAAMQAGIDAGYREIGAELGVQVAPAGDAWQRAQSGLADAGLWQADGSHPTVAGTYLAACVLFAEIFGASPVGISSTEGLSDAGARALQEVAWSTVSAAATSQGDEATAAAAPPPHGPPDARHTPREY